uniref:C-type lectin domain-containing protein n=1 Tax=Plectus sambesii TaxID=2011161 RepID=A0A914VFN9_9BILA
MQPQAANAASGCIVTATLETVTSVYFGTSCLILHTELKKFNAAKLSCLDILGYSGHLVHIRSLSYQPVIESLMNASSVSTVWTGTECYGTCTTASSTGWYYTTSARKYEESATFIAWSATGKTGNSVAWQKGQKSIAVVPTNTYAFICEYEEKYAYKITAAAKYCLSKPPNFPSYRVSGYVDGSCFINPGVTPVAGKIRSACPNVTGLVSRLAHLSSTAKRTMGYSLGRALMESSYNNLVSDIGGFQFSIGLEQLSACTANACAEEGSYSWFWTTPEGYKWPAKTQESYFWGAGSPTTSTTNSYANIDGGYEGLLDCDSGKITGAGGLCEYIDPYSFSNFDNACLLSSNPSATGYSSCFTLNRIATTFDLAKGKCTEFPNGYLARVNTVEMGTFLSTALWAKTGLPPTMPLYTGLRRNGTQWYWMYPDGTSAAANSSNLPWDASQPQAGNDCALLGQNGLLKTGSCTTNQWYLCHYRNEFYESFLGTAKIKASPSATIKETNNFTFRQCRQSCQNNGECTSFAYAMSNSICQLISGSSITKVAAPEFIWYSLGP